MFVNVIKYKDMKKKAEELIRELVPELQELKEGCVFSVNDEVFKFVTSGASGGFAYSNRKHRTVQFSFRELSYYDDDSVNIVGSEIHLEHIILAAERVPHDKYLELYTKKPFGITMFVWRNGAGEQVDYNYNKPFQEQSEEFYKFLVDILK